MLKMNEIRDLFPMAVGAVIDYTNGDIILDLPNDDDFTEDIIYGCLTLRYVMKSCRTLQDGSDLVRYTLEKTDLYKNRARNLERIRTIEWYEGDGRRLLHR
jgi:hypothetical protein